MKQLTTIEVFKVDTPVIWRGGEEMGSFITTGKITKVIGKPYIGTLECTFSSGKEFFNKKDGSHTFGNGYIRLS